MMTKKRKKILIAVVTPFAVIAIFAIFLVIYAKTPIESVETSTILVDIPTGTSFMKITGILSDAGLVKNKPLFYSLAAVKRAFLSIRAGEYEFSTSLSPLEVVNKLIRGETKYYPVTIQEDYSLKEIAARLKEDKLIDEKTFFELASDKAFLELVGIQASSIEGYLFPDTYFLTRTMSTKQIMRVMVNRFWNKITPEMINLAVDRGLNVHQFVTFASLVGKETGYSSEKPMIAAVFYNRLKKNMPLQSDPTTVYDLKNFDGRVLRIHYRRESPYNTYIIRGLPPGPISNPGLDSFQAVLNPANVNHLYFVSRGDGTHFFSATLDEHNIANARIRSLKNSIKMDEK